jgi:hypothetical protein
MSGSAARRLCGAWLVCAVLGPVAPALAQPGAAPMVTESAPAKPGKRSWSIREFTSIRLVRREPGSAPNQHPAAISPALLNQQLGMIQFVAGSAAQRLFWPDELGELAVPLSQAIASAGPDDDLVLLSTSRRGEGFLSQPTAITARLFVQDGTLQVLINDTRLDFVNHYRGSNIEPEFVFGSRAKAGPALVQSAAARSVRPDWLSLPLSVPAAASTPPAAPAAAATAPAVPASADEIERRLTTLKRLRERNLITEEEYQSKRRQILQQL